MIRSLNDSTHWRATERVGRAVALRSFDVRLVLFRAVLHEPRWWERIGALVERTRARWFAEVEET